MFMNLNKFYINKNPLFSHVFTTLQNCTELNKEDNCLYSNK